MRRGLTLIELLFTLLIAAGLFLMIWSFFGAGRSTLETGGRRLDAINRTHLRFEALRHDLQTTPWAFAAVPPPAAAGEPAEAGPGGGHGLSTQGRELRFHPQAGTLEINGRTGSASYKDMRFWNLPEHRIQLLLAADESRPGAGEGTAIRERSTLVSRVFLDLQAENVRDRSHVFEADHEWCVNGGSIHYGISE